MTGHVKCFMLEVEDHKHSIFSAVVKESPVHLQLCPDTGRAHRVNLEIDGDEGLSQATTRLMPINCSCGFQLTMENSMVWTGTYSQKYTNPKTGKSGHTPNEVKSPGAMWYCPWYWHVDDEIITGSRRTELSSLLSRFYLETWSGVRPPICVCCPDGRDWVVDMKSKNGDGWVVTGDAPNLTCIPSVDTGTYHSYLVNGVFGLDPSFKGI